MKRALAFLLVGLIAGAVATNTYLSQKTDELYISREKLRTELYETKEKLKAIEARLQESQAPIITDLEIRLIKEAESPLLELELRKAAIEITQGLIGENLENTSPGLVFSLLDERAVEAGGKHYLLKVRAVVLSKKIIYELDYELFHKKLDDEP